MVLKIFSSSHSHADLAPHVCFLMNHHIIFAYLPTSNHLFSSFLIFSHLFSSFLHPGDSPFLTRWRWFSGDPELHLGSLRGWLSQYFGAELSSGGTAEGDLETAGAESRLVAEPTRRFLGDGEMGTQHEK